MAHHISEANQGKKAKRRTVAKFALAGIALLGIGAAATSAAWTDQAWFSGTASAASIELEASLNGTTWVSADTEGAAVAIVPASTFQNLVPNETRTVTIQIRNSSPSVSLSVAPPSITKVAGGTLWAAGSTATVTTDYGASNVTLTPGEVKPVIVSVSSGALPDSFQGATGNLTLSFTGTTLS